MNPTMWKTINRLVLCSLLALGTMTLGACEAKSKSSDETSESDKDDDDEDDEKKKDKKEKKEKKGDTKAAFAKGDEVEVKWNGSWYKGSVVEVKGDKFKVHYKGWSDSFDEEVPADRLRTPQGIKWTWKKDDAVEVQWKKKWYKATILEVEGEDKFKVHYDGWDAQWDESVEGNRIRKRQS